MFGSGHTIDIIMGIIPLDPVTPPQGIYNWESP